MGRARRARRIAQTAAYGGGFGCGDRRAGRGGLRPDQGRGADGAPDVGHRSRAPPRTTASTAPRRSPDRPARPRRQQRGRPGCRRRAQTIGAILATGVSAFSGRRVRLTNVAVVGAVSGDLGVQVANALDEVPRPDAAVIIIGTNDITHRIDKSLAVRHLEADGPPAARRRRRGRRRHLSRPRHAPAGRPAAAAAGAALEPRPGRGADRRGRRGGRPHCLAGRDPRPRVRGIARAFSNDRFHPSPAGYARAAADLALEQVEAVPHWQTRGRR